MAKGHKSVMVHQFAQVPQANIPRSSFDRSHGYKTTFDAGTLIPFFCDEVVPGDTFNLRANLFGRLATPIAPIMDNLIIETFFFFVPNRLVWTNWQKFCGEQLNPGDSTDYLIPQVVAPAGGFDHGSIYDYFGIPCGVPNISVSALPFRAYARIYNEWFRDQNFSSRANNGVNDGPDLDTAHVLRTRGKRHDYFTSCLPWPQKGDEVNVPIAGFAPVYTTASPTISGSYPGLTWMSSQGVPPANNAGIGWQAAGGAVTNAFTQDAGWGATAYLPSNLAADLTDATGVTINELRESFQIQRMLERDARSGTRYTEVVRAHFGVISPDARLQRPELLGIGRSYVNVNPVAQTSGTPLDSATGYTPTPQGNLSAYGTFSGSKHGFSKSFTEHGFVIGIINARADLTYQQGIERFWSRKTRYDHYWPALAHLGEQAVLNKEIYAQGTAADDDVFGYQERWAEMRYKPSRITGAFNSSHPTPLDYWHLSQDFTELPLLNATFINDQPPIDRIIAVPSEPHFLLDVYFNYRCARPMPTYSVPGLIDHL